MLWGEALELLRAEGALREDLHVVLTSGRHSDMYCNLRDVLRRKRVRDQLGHAIASRIPAVAPDIVVGLPLGGALLAPAVARAYSGIMGREVQSLALPRRAETENYWGASKQFCLTHEQIALLDHINVLVVDDVYTRGTTIREAVGLLSAYTKARITGMAVVFCRAELAEFHRIGRELGVPTSFALTGVVTPDYALAECPKCQAGIPWDETLGHGALGQKGG